MPPNRIVVRMSVTARAAWLIKRSFLARPAHALSLPDNFAPSTATWSGRRSRFSRCSAPAEVVLLMAALVLDDLRALDDREQRSASGRVTKFSGEPLEDDVSTLHPVGGTA